MALDDIAGALQPGPLLRCVPRTQPSLPAADLQALEERRLLVLSDQDGPALCPPEFVDDLLLDPVGAVRATAREVVVALCRRRPSTQTYLQATELVLTDVELVTRRWESNVALLDLLGARTRSGHRTVLVCAYRWSYPWVYSAVEAREVAMLFLVGEEAREILDAGNPPR